MCDLDEVKNPDSAGQQQLLWLATVAIVPRGDICICLLPGPSCTAMFASPKKENKTKNKQAKTIGAFKMPYIVTLGELKLMMFLVVL